MLPRQCLALILALVCVPPAWAGMDKEGSSQRPGLFFAWLSPDDGPVWAQFENPAHLQQLVRHCNTGAPVFALQAGTRYQCKAELPQKSAGQEEPYAAGMTVQGPAPQADPRQYRLFALTPPRTPQWVVGNPDAEQRDALQSFLQSDGRRFGALRRQLQLDAARTVLQCQGVRTTVVVSGRVVRDRNAFTKPSGTMFLCVAAVGMPTWASCPASQTAMWTSTATTCRGSWCTGLAADLESATRLQWD